MCDIRKPLSHFEHQFPHLINGSNTIDFMSIDCNNIHGILCLQLGILKVFINFCHFVFHNIFVHLSVLWVLVFILQSFGFQFLCLLAF